MPHTRSVSISIYVGAGSRYESSDKAGVSHFIEHLCFKGTERMPTARQISETIEGIGGILNAGTDREATVYWAKVARDHLDTALELLVDILRSSKFDPAEIEKERLVVLEELNMMNEYPGHRAEALLDELMWQDNPLGRDVGGTKESVRNITRDDMLSYMSHQYILSNMVVSVAGNIDHEVLVEKIGNLTNDWPTNTLLDWQGAPDGQKETRFKLEQRKTDQAHICIGFHGLAADHPDRYALGLLSSVLGEGMSSRLFLEVRENQGLAYDVHSGADHLKDCGSFAIYAGVDPKRAAKAIKIILKVLSEVKDGIPQVEMDKVREFAKGRLLLRMEDTRAVGGWLGSQELLRGEILTVDEVVSRLNAINPEDLQRVAQQVLREDNLSMSVVGPYRSDRQFRGLLTL
jgi:predicted Zn-dependent peptidase